MNLSSSHKSQDTSTVKKASNMEGFKESSLLFVYDAFPLALSYSDILKHFTAECKAAGMKISTVMSKAMVRDLVTYGRFECMGKTL